MKSWKPSVSFRDTITSWTDTFPEPCASNSLKASNKLKSGLSAHSILALSSSRSRKMLSLRTRANSCCSILSKEPKLIPAFFGGASTTPVSWSGDARLGEWRSGLELLRLGFRLE